MSTSQQRPSLSEVHETVPLPRGGPLWRRWLAVTGPALMVAVGYMDPGNWATDLAAGSRYNYALIWVLLMSNLMAILLQSLAARLGIVAQRDLAQACRESLGPWVNVPLYVLAEIAITATDLAEVLGSAIALQLLFGLPLIYGVIITGLDVMILLVLMHFGIRKLEALVIAFIGTIGAAFLIEIFLARPDWGGIARGMVPSLPDSHALYIAIGILGATVMPHNLYLHSSLVQTRRVHRSAQGIRRAIRINNIDSAVALNLAFLVNAAILVMAAAVFYRSGHHDVAEIQDAYHLLEPLLGAAIAPIAFAVALLASGQSSTITGTLAGQIVMEGHLNVRIRPWLRRLITRLAAILPAVLAIVYFGEESTGGLLVLSQVILSLQLPFAVIPLIHFVRDRQRMGRFAIGIKTQVVAWLVAGVIVGLNLKLGFDEVSLWLAQAGEGAWLVHLVVWPLVALIGLLLLYVTFLPLAQRVGLLARPAPTTTIHQRMAAAELSIPSGDVCQRVAVGLDFSGGEDALLGQVVRMFRPFDPEIVLLHVIESPAARVVGGHVADREARDDADRLEAFAQALRAEGFAVSWALGAGDAVRALAEMVRQQQADVLVLGTHQHRMVGDLLLGATADAVRHLVDVPAVMVPLR